MHSFEVTYEIWRSAHSFSYYYFSVNAEFAFRWALSIRISKVIIAKFNNLWNLRTPTSRRRRRRRHTMAVYVLSFRHVMRTKLTLHIRSGAEQYSIFRYRYRRLDKDKSQSATPTRLHAEKPLIEYQSGESESKSESWTSKSESKSSHQLASPSHRKTGLESDSSPSPESEYYNSVSIPQSNQLHELTLSSYQQQFIIRTTRRLLQVNILRLKLNWQLCIRVLKLCRPSSSSIAVTLLYFA